MNSLDFEILVGHIVSLYFVLCNIKESDDATGAGISVASQSNATLNELFAFVKSHIFFVVGVDVTPDECAS